MPKIIDNIEEKIYNAAFELFTNKGYDSVNMKMVAKKTGIAVGTLYNYHQNKKRLYLNVFKNSWEETFNKIDTILKEKNEGQKLESLINTLYTDISKRRGFAQELIKSKKLIEAGMKFIEDFKKEIKGKIKEALTAYAQHKEASISEGKKTRLAQLVFTEIIALNSEFGEEKEKNIKFLMELINSTLC